MIRDKWYFTDAQGHLVSTLYLTADEYALRPDKDRLKRDGIDDTPAARPMPVYNALQDAKKAALIKINDDRLIEINSPIMVEGILIDGDIVAREAVATKRNEIKDCEDSGEPIGLCVWRDAMNVTHTFELATYKLWLRSAAIAISKRATNILAASWARKEAVEAATTIEQVQQIMNSTAGSEEL